MKAFPKGKEFVSTIGRVLLWSFPLLLSVPSPQHGFQWEFMIIIPGAWVVGAVIGLIRNPNKDAKIFYGTWLLGLFALILWCSYVPSFVAQKYH